MPTDLRLRARWVVPVSSEPIENGEIVVEEGRIAAVRPAPAESAAPHVVLDLGDAILLPGLVNVHTHLDYTIMRGLLEDIPFFPWIRELTARKAALDERDWIASATMGAAEAVSGGVTTIGDCTDSGAALLGAKALGLRGLIYQEVFGIDESVSVAEAVADLDLKVRALRWQATGTRLKVGVSPHAPYTVRPELFLALADYVAENELSVCIHAAESQAEAELIRHGSGAIREMFDRRGIDWTAPGGSTVSYLSKLGLLGAKTMLVHGTQFSASDRRTVGETSTAWAHCPKSNAKLGNGIAPLGLIRSSYPGEQRVGLGSDSVASNNTMDLFEEMRFAVLAQRGRSRRYDAVTSREAVELATIGGARALGMDRHVGTLEPGKQADIAAVSLDRLHMSPCYNPYNALVYTAGARDVSLTMIGGEIVYEDDRFPHIDLAPVRDRFRCAADKMRAWSPPE
jgi:cytosine/adenosine deaminase-related metal-dependent hydrolase